MAQHDYVIDNSTGANVRADINNALLAIASNNSGSSAPSTTYAFQLFADTTNNVMKIRNAANNAFIELFQLDGTLTLENGSATAPALAFRDDLNTGIFSGGADEFNISTGGAERLVIKSSGNVGIGTTSPVDPLHVSSDGGVHVRIESTTSGSARLALKSPASTYTGLHFGDDADLDVGRIRYYHTDNHMQFSTGASERMRIDSSGNVGIGVTSIDSALHVYKQTNDRTARFQRISSQHIDITQTSSVNSFTSTGKDFEIGTTDSQNLIFDTNGSERMRIDSSGRVLIGLNSNAANASIDDLQVGNPNDSNQSGITIGSNDEAAIAFANTSDARAGSITYNMNDDAMIFKTNGQNERMRMDSGGRVLIGTTSSSNTDNSLEVRNASAGGALGVTSSNSSSQQDFILFKVGSGNTANGGIRRDGSTNGVELFSGSDRRIKTNIENMDNVLEKINKLSLKKFDFKQGGSGVGVIAQDLISIFPNKVKKDDSDDGTGDTVPDGVEAWTVGHNFTYELLKAVQELTARVEALEAA